MSRTCLRAAIVVALLCPSAALAAFVNGVERFEGTVPDLATWQPLRTAADPGGEISQDNALLINNLRGLREVDYTTRTFPVGVGEGVRVDVTPLEEAPGPNLALDIGIYLTTNSGGDVGALHDDIPYLSLTRLQAIPQFGFPEGVVIGISNPGGGEPLRTPSGDLLSQELGETLVYEIVRVSDSSVRFRALGTEGDLRGSVTHGFSSPMSNDLAVALTTLNSSARFDNVTLVPIPLPPGVAPGLGMLGVMVGGRLWWARRRVR